MKEREQVATDCHHAQAAVATVPPVKFGKRYMLAKPPESLIVPLVLEQYMVKHQGIA